MEIHEVDAIQTVASHAESLVQPVLSSACKEDFDLLAPLFAALHAYNASFNEKFTLSANWREIVYKQFLQSFEDTCSHWVAAWVKQQPVGLMIMQKPVVSFLFPQSNQAELVALYTDPAYRRLGIASQLMEYAIQWSISQGIANLQLYVSSENTHARAFYRRCGWYPVQEIWHRDVIPPENG